MNPDETSDAPKTSQIGSDAYVLITPAHNEAAFIERTIVSVLAQTVRPIKWVIVNDASTDSTRATIERYLPANGFITLVNLERASGRNFANKVRAFNRGLCELRALSFGFIGNLDADISFEPTYYESVLREFANDATLGIAGGLVHSQTAGCYVPQDTALDSVAGAVQLFRRACFGQIGGYIAMPYGGIDAAAEISARMNGWTVRTLPHLKVLEHRFTGSATAPPLLSRLKEGRRMQSLGYGSIFFLLRCLYRLSHRPLILGSCAAYYGFLAAKLAREPIALPADAVRYLRAEQHKKLMRLLRLHPHISSRLHNHKDTLSCAA